MADRFPLILNRSSNLIQEIASGDNLDLTGNNIVGINSVTASTASFSGNVSIGGTLTYEDVTSIDSVGVITARDNIKVGTGVTITPAGGGFYAGIVTATSFVGDGSSLTGISGGVTSDAQENTVGGTNAGDSFNGTNALRNTLFGYDAGTDITNADDATAVGRNALGSLSVGARNTAVGAGAGSNITYSDNNTCIGYNAGNTGGSGNLVDGVNNILLGYEARATATNVSNEVTIGNEQITKFRIPGINFILKDNGGTPTQGHVLTVDGSGEAGFAAGGVSSDAQGNTVGGSNAGDSFNGTNAQYNTLIGKDAGTAITNAIRNTVLGYQALQTNTNSSYNVAIGYRALYTQNITTNPAGGQNVAIGDRAGYDVTDGRNSVYVGAGAGFNVTNGGENVIIGSYCGTQLTTGSNCIIFGQGAQASANNVSNEVTIGDSNITKFRVPGISLSIERNGAVIAGVVTATSFSGSGANLTNLPPSAPVGGASTNQVFFENDKLVEVNYQITSTKNAMTAGPISVSAGIAVTVPSGCSWTIV